MKAAVFLDAFAECLVNVSVARMTPGTTADFRALAIRSVATRHGDGYAVDVGKMFDRLMSGMQRPESKWR